MINIGLVIGVVLGSFVGTLLFKTTQVMPIEFWKALWGKITWRHIIWLFLLPMVIFICFDWR